MYSALSIAHYLVRESIRNNIQLTAFKVEFMVCFAHGWHLAIDGRPLIDEPLKAYRHGPVIESVHKFYGKVKRIETTVNEDMIDCLKEQDREFLYGILVYYGHLNELEMQSLCIEEGTPWFATYKKSSGALVIEDQRIKVHYKLLHVSHPEFCDLDDPISIMATETNNH